MPLPIKVSHEGGIATFDIGVSLLERREVQPCLVQTGPVEVGVGDRDGMRPAVVAALTQLFAEVAPGCGEAILRERARIKRQTLIDRRLSHHAQAA